MHQSWSCSSAPSFGFCLSACLLVSLLADWPLIVQGRLSAAYFDSFVYFHCVALSESAPVEYNMVPSLQYTANPAESLSPACQESYNNSLLSALRSSGAAFKQLCPTQTAIVAVTYKEGSLQFTYDSTAQRVGLQVFVVVKFKLWGWYSCLKHPQSIFAS